MGAQSAPGRCLAAGDLGIAMGAAGSDVAINSVSIALMSDDLRRLPFLVRSSRSTRSNKSHKPSAKSEQYLMQNQRPR
jgi:Cd2+/Zn2+-exporting ATPase